MAERHEEIHFEERDLSLKLLFWLAGGTLVFLLATSFGMSLLTSYAPAQHQMVDDALHPRPAFDTSQIFPTPRLQWAPRSDLARYRAQEERLLSTYGWVSKDQRVARIPIARAIELYLAKAAASPKAASDEAVEPKDSKRATDPSHP